LKTGIAVGFGLATMVFALGTSAQQWPPGSCAGIVGQGYATVTVRGAGTDGRLSGTASYQLGLSSSGGRPQDAQVFSAEFTGVPKADGAVDLLRKDGSVWYADMRRSGNQLVGRYFSADRSTTFPVNMTCQ
jgi:hypothetical protein